MLITRNGEEVSVDAMIHCPDNYFKNILKAALYYMDYWIEWHDFQRRTKSNENWEEFEWEAERGRISIRTMFTKSDGDRVMCFEEFCMWVSAAYLNKIAL